MKSARMLSRSSRPLRCTTWAASPTLVTLPAALSHTLLQPRAASHSVVLP
jgi:hypothetical protein